jgi:hypothetical protein
MRKFQRLDRYPAVAQPSRDFLLAGAFEPEFDGFLDHRLGVFRGFPLADDVQFRAGRDKPAVFAGSDNGSQWGQDHSREFSHDLCAGRTRIIPLQDCPCGVLLGRVPIAREHRSAGVGSGVGVDVNYRHISGKGEWGKRGRHQRQRLQVESRPRSARGWFERK